MPESGNIRCSIVPKLSLVANYTDRRQYYQMRAVLAKVCFKVWNVFLHLFSSVMWPNNFSHVTESTIHLTSLNIYIFVDRNFCAYKNGQLTSQ